MENQGKKKSIREMYLAELEARDFTAHSGFVFRVRGVTNVAFAELLSGLPPAVTKNGAASDEALSPEMVKRHKQYQKDMYDRFVDGVVDPETNEAELIPFEAVLQADLDPVLDFAMKRGGIGSAKAAEIARAL